MTMTKTITVWCDEDKCSEWEYIENGASSYKDAEAGLPRNWSKTPAGHFCSTCTKARRIPDEMISKT